MNPGNIAPPCVRTKSPFSSSCLRSRPIVINVTPNSFANALLRTVSF